MHERFIHIKRILLFLSYTFLPDLGITQEFLVNIESYGIEEGLSHQNILDIHQDKRGFIWLGTSYGLNRYDGYNFVWYTKEKHGFQSNTIHHLFEDGDGWLWLLCGTEDLKSIDLFHPITEEVFSIETFFGENLPFSVSDVIEFSSSSSGSIAFITRANKLIIYSSERGFKVSDLKIRPIELGKFSKRNTLWVYTRKNDNSLRDVILEIDFEGKVLNRYEHDFPFNYNYMAGSDEYDNLWYLSKYWFKDRFELERKGRIYKIDREGNESKISLSETALSKDKVNLDLPTYGNEHGFWLNPRDGVFWLMGRGSFQGFDLVADWHIDLASQYAALSHINTVYFDRQNKTWIGTSFGLLVIDRSLNPFQSLSFDPTNRNILAFRGITEDSEGSIWACIDRGSGWLARFRKEGRYFQSEILATETVEWGRGYKYGIFKDSKGSIWFGSRRDSVLTRLNPVDSTFGQYRYAMPDKERFNLWSFYEDKNELIWVGSDNASIGYISADSITFLPKVDKLYQQGGCIYDFHATSSGKILVSTDDGLYELDLEEKSFQEFPTDVPYLNAGIYHLHEDKDGNFWLGTNGQGLIFWNPTSNEFRQFTRADGLSDNTVYAVYEDDFGHLWLPSNYGIIQFNKSTYQTRAFLQKDGISGSEFNRISHYQSKDGTLFFGGTNGVTAFHPKDLLFDTILINTPLVITDFQQFVADKTKLVNKTKELLATNKIVFAPTDPFFRIEFGLLTYEDVDNIQYAYKIEGQDQNWNYQKENYLRLSRLPYGNYVLKIKGQTSNGQWSPQELAIDITVLTPFYIETWFILTVILITMGSAYFLYKRRTSQLERQKILLEEQVVIRTATIQKQAEELKSLEQLKSRFFANVSHELRTPLTLMLGPVKSLLKRNKKDTSERKLLEYIERNGQQLMKLTNEILDLSKLEANKLEVDEVPVNFHSFLTKTTAQFYSFGASEGVSFSVENQVDEALILMLDKSKFEKIIHNFLSNALKFTPTKGKVTLRVEGKEKTLLASVKDTGTGIHIDDLPYIFDRFYQSKKETGLEKGGTGIGLSLSKELAELLGGSVWAESKIGQGSTFYFEFPRKVVSEEKVAPSSIKEFSALTNSVISSDAPKNILASNKTEALKNTKILIVEDNIDLRNYLSFLLSDYTIELKENGQKALDWCMQTEKQPDLIITDLMMPVMDGFEFMEKIKSIDEWRHIPVIMLTAKVNIKAKLKAFLIGIDDYLNKPFAEEELKARVENMLYNYRERLKFFQKNTSQNLEQEKPKPLIGAADAEWLQQIESIFQNNLSDSSFTMSFVAHKLNLSQRQVSRRLKQLTGLTPRTYLQEMRLHTAKEMLFIGRFATVKETAYAVGYRDMQSFSDRFQERFGVLPSSYLR